MPLSDEQPSVPIFHECGCDWRGTEDATVPPPHAPDDRLCPECHEPTEVVPRFRVEATFQRDGWQIVERTAKGYDLPRGWTYSKEEEAEAVLPLVQAGNVWPSVDEVQAAVAALRAFAADRPKSEGGASPQTS